MRVLKTGTGLGYKPTLAVVRRTVTHLRGGLSAKDLILVPEPSERAHIPFRPILFRLATWQLLTLNAYTRF